MTEVSIPILIKFKYYDQYGNGDGTSTFDLHFYKYNCNIIIDAKKLQTVEGKSEIDFIVHDYVRLLQQYDKDLNNLEWAYYL